MNASINCGLKGAYKVDIYKGGGPSRKFVETTDWFSNDITNVGLNYPFVYPFAQCFMFLSLGSQVHNYGGGADNNRPFTGLAAPIPSYMVYDPNSGYFRQSGQYIGWQGYEIGGRHDSTYNSAGASSACGTVFTSKGLNMHRGWTIPTGSFERGNVVGEENGLIIQQFMVSPTSNISGSGGYNPSGAAAFSLVNRTVIIPSGYSATITYQLSLNFANYSGQYTYFSGVQGDSNGYFSTGNASTGANGSDERPLLSGWANLSGIYRLIFPAVQIVDRMGACVITKMGEDLEPYRDDCKDSSFYLSTDISQFAINKFGRFEANSKFPQIKEDRAYNSCGLMASYTEFLKEYNVTPNIFSNKEDGSIFSEADEWFYSGESQKTAETTELEILENIRLENMLNISNYLTGEIKKQRLNYQTNAYVSSLEHPVAFATPGYAGFDSNFQDFGQQAIYSSYLKRFPLDKTITGTGTAQNPQRTKYVTRRALFPPLSSYGTNSRYGSLVLGYNTAVSRKIGYADYQPYIDFLFFDNSGRGANMPHYRIIPDLYLTERGSGVASVRFDITGNEGSIPGGVERIYSVYGFMGPGDSNQQNSGLNTEHPMLMPSKILDTTPSSFIPPGSKSSGFLFPGVSINENVGGDYTYNNNTGWGAVYGIVANSGFYRTEYDLCVIDNPIWSGFSGGIPNPTGDNNRLFWPVQGSGMGVRITGLSYYAPIYGRLSDNNFKFKDGNYQVISDILYTGVYLRNNPSNLSSYTGYPSVSDRTCFVFVSGTGKPLTPLTFLNYNTDSLSGTTTGLLNNQKIGFNLNSLGNYIELLSVAKTSSDIGYGKNWTPEQITGSYLIPSGFGDLNPPSNSIFLALGNLNKKSDDTFLVLTGSNTKNCFGPITSYKITDITGHYSGINGTSVTGITINKLTSSVFNSSGIYLWTGDPGSNGSIVKSSDWVNKTGYLSILSGASEMMRIQLDITDTNANARVTGISGITSYLTQPLGYGKKWTDITNFSISHLVVDNNGQSLFNTNTFLYYYRSATPATSGIIKGNATQQQGLSVSGVKQYITEITGASLLENNTSNNLENMNVFFSTGVSAPTSYNDFLNVNQAANPNCMVTFKDGTSNNVYQDSLSKILKTAPNNKAWLDTTKLKSLFDSWTLVESLDNLILSGDFGDYLGETIRAYSYKPGQMDWSEFDIITGSKDFPLLASQFKQPQAVIHHLEGIGQSGFRLLPNYALPNNKKINTYYPTRGGQFPGMSDQNGMEIYLNFSWSGT